MSNTLLEVSLGNEVIRVFADGSGLLTANGQTYPLGEAQGRYVLRLNYDALIGGAALHQLLEDLQLTRICRRTDCRRPIPRDRQLAALERNQPAQWCSVRCLKTAAARRWRARRTR